MGSDASCFAAGAPGGGTGGEDAGSGIGSGTDESIRSTKSTESTGETTTCFASKVPTNG